MPARLKAVLISALSAISGVATASAVTSGFVDVEGGGRLYYETVGSGEPVVLIHGNAGDRRHWDKHFRALGEHFYVIRYDVRGYGKSSLPTVGSSYSDRKDLRMLLDQLNIDRAHIVGWSFGSGVAFDFATAFPDRTLSIISVGPWVNGYSSAGVQEFGQTMAAFGSELVENGPEAGIEAWMRLIFPTTIRDAAAGEELARIAADYSWWAFTHPSQSRPLEPSADERLRDIEAPTLILTADFDLPACQEMSEHLHGSIKHSELRMSDTGHLMAIEKPEEFNQILIAFLRENASDYTQDVLHWPDLRCFRGSPARPECATFRTIALHNGLAIDDPIETI